MENFGLYFITDGSLTRANIFDDALAAINAGVKIIQYRDKFKEKNEIIKEAVRLRDIAKKRNVFLIINDYVNVAKEINADGVHLGEGDINVFKARKILGKNRIIGKSTHSLEQAKQAQSDPLDYISVGPIFKTATKPGYKPVGTGLLNQVLAFSKFPVVAIGGINSCNINHVLKTGAKNIAAIRATVNTDNVESECKKIIGLIQNSV